MRLPGARTRMPEVHVDPRHPLGEFFDGFRRARREHYERVGTPQTRNRRAVLTIVHDEAVFFPIWLSYYSRFFGSSDIYVLDHETSDGSTSGERFVRVPVSNNGVDHTWMVRMLEAKQHELLEIYDVVLVADVDEIVCPLPQWGTLEQYLNRFNEDFVNPLGYELLHMRDREPAYRPAVPVMQQRSYWFANDAYDKPALARVPMSWEPGLHKRTDGESAWDPDLRLIHLHRLDYEICRERHRLRLARNWAETDLELGWARHNLISEGREFERWFYEDSGVEDENIHMVVEAIPESWKGTF